MTKGKFVISLDFELHWGIFDVKSVDDYKTNLDNTRKAIQEMLRLSEAYQIRLTFATVGFLFAENKQELTNYFPNTLPAYHDPNFSPYNHMDIVGANEDEDPYHFAFSVIKELKRNPIHEIGTHTFSHYYAKEKGQNTEQFEEDLLAAIKIAKTKNIVLRSIVFPRNQINEQYVQVCAKHGIISYRGTEKAFIYRIYKYSFVPKLISRGLGLLDCYVNLSGYNTYSLDALKKEGIECLNIPSSRFLRPFNSKLRFLENLKMARIKKAMTNAAKKSEIFHLWWHPHNFGNNLPQNISNLKSIYEHFLFLNKNYGFESDTMHSLSENSK